MRQIGPPPFDFLFFFFSVYDYIGIDVALGVIF